MPGHLRPGAINVLGNESSMFQSRTICQALCDVYKSRSYAGADRSFNLERDARPFATRITELKEEMNHVCQSRTRCQPLCDARHGMTHASGILVSISNEMPAPLRQQFKRVVRM